MPRSTLKFIICIDGKTSLYTMEADNSIGVVKIPRVLPGILWLDIDRILTFLPA